MPYVEVRQRCESAPHLLKKGPGFVLYAIMDFVVDHYFPIVDELEEELEKLEEEIFGGNYRRETTERIYDLKRDLLGLKRAVSPLIDICNRLTRFDSPLIDAESRPYFRDVYDHVIRINETVDNLRELLNGALEANLSLISVQQNEVTKKLAAWAAILAVPTMVAGIYGMNFEFMPELQWALGYPVVMGSMFSACGSSSGASRSPAGCNRAAGVRWRDQQRPRINPAARPPSAPSCRRPGSAPTAIGEIGEQGGDHLPAAIARARGETQPLAAERTEHAEDRAGRPALTMSGGVT